MSSTLSRADLLDRLDAGETLLLPTPYAAAQLRSAFDTRQRAAGLAAWQPAAVLAWTQWTQSLWSGLVVEGAEPRLLLNSAQEHALWREIVAETALGALGSPDALAELASSAWQLAAQHQVLHRLRATANTHDSRIFAEWAEAFGRRSTQRNVLSAALLELSLQQHLEMGALQPPRTLTLVGFLDRTPARQALLDAFAARRTRVVEHTLTIGQGTAVRAHTTLKTEYEEMQFAARWVRSRVQADPAARIAVLVPDLSAVRAELEETLRETLAPELQSVQADLAAAPWQFTNGPALATLPLLADALRLAHWAAHALSGDAVTALLLSPYIAQNATEPERSASARFDAAVLRRAPMLRDEIRLPWLLQLAQQSARRDERVAAVRAQASTAALSTEAQRSSGEMPAFKPPAIFAALEDLHTTLQRNDLQRPRTWADWTEFIRDLTRAMQWPGSRSLNAMEFEATRAWDSLLDTLATLDFTARRIPYATFLAELDRQATSTVFTGQNAGAPHLDFEMGEATNASPVQILTPAESIGCSFDAVLFLRATDANWPAAEHVHPLLAWPLQRALAMPGIDPAQAAARGRVLTDDLLARCGDVLFSHATEDADGKLRGSSLIAASPRVAAEDLVAPPARLEPIALEAFEDTSALPSLLSGDIPGGSAVLKLQAACGFLAFAALRLRSAELETPELGLDAGESGTLLHRTLQMFWAEVKTQQELSRLSTADRERLLGECIDAALPQRLRPETAWDEAYLAVQKDRLLAVLLPWLELELERSPFEVRAIETGQQITIGPLTLDLRLDRLDSIAGVNGEPGGFVLVDYKTGFAGTPRDWETERPGDPQLPLYALLHEPGELKGLAFAKVRAGKEMKWYGLQAEADILPSPRSNHVVELEYLLQDWRQTLTQLAEDFAAGDAGVRPRDFRVDCMRCAQRLLCRVDFAALEASHPMDDLESQEDALG